MNLANDNDNPWEELVYRKGRQINRWPYTAVVSGVMRLLGNGLARGSSVLELGCGTGNNLRFLADEGFRAFGIDNSETAIEIARRQLAGWNLEADLRCGSFTQLPFEDETFNLVIDRAALVHNEYPRLLDAIQEAHRVMKPGAFLLSFGLNGLEHRDRRYGKQVATHTWGTFSSGKFKDAGVTCFFEPEEIEELFSPFSTVDWKIHQVLGSNGEVRDETFEVSARK